MSAVTVRFARPGDAASIHGFIVGLAMHVGHPDEVEVTPEGLARQLESERPPFECLLAEIDGEAVGSAIFFANYSTFGLTITRHVTRSLSRCFLSCRTHGVLS